MGHLEFLRTDINDAPWGWLMKRYKMISMMLLLLLISGCYLPMSGRVVDGETKQPIEGAVVLVEWTEEHGLGLTYHTVYKIAETETDKQGRFSLPGAYNPLVDQPCLVIYKQGYVAWRNDTVFPSFEKRRGYDVWEHGYEYKLERFKDGYSRDLHSSFMDTGLIGLDVEHAPKFEAAYGYELREGMREIEEKKNKLRGDK